MPEGDTIHRIAVKLGPRLIGQVLERVTTQGLARQIAGTTVTGVTAVGKHLVIDVDTGSYLRMHLGMYGRQRSYQRRDGEAMLARMSPGRVSLALVTPTEVHLWIGARTVEISDRRAPLHGHAISALGPDVLGDDFDSRLAAERASVHPMRAIAEVLLDQRIASGIGNVYKCEVLFLRGIDPRTRTGDLDLGRLEALYTTARELMMENVEPSAGMRSTRERLAGDRPGDERYFVYSRSGKPCRRCQGVISCYQLGTPPRWTWSCADCQPQCGASS